MFEDLPINKKIDKLEELEDLIAIMGFVPRTVVSWEDSRAIKGYLTVCKQTLEDQLKYLPPQTDN